MEKRREEKVDKSSRKERARRALTGELMDTCDPVTRL